jgi:hypothetical protein
VVRRQRRHRVARHRRRCVGQLLPLSLHHHADTCVE